jgi:hypothetical protein
MPGFSGLLFVKRVERLREALAGKTLLLEAAQRPSADTTECCGEAAAEETGVRSKCSVRGGSISVMRWFATSAASRGELCCVPTHDGGAEPASSQLATSWTEFGTFRAPRSNSETESIR